MSCLVAVELHAGRRLLLECSSYCGVGVNVRDLYGLCRSKYDCCCS
jgi:hypothetical protein